MSSLTIWANTLTTYGAMKNKNPTVLTDQQSLALQFMLSSSNIFLTGCAGSGKSYLIGEYMKLQDPKEVPILASTGAAAVLINGRTFHSFFGLGILEGGVATSVERALKNRQVVRRLKKIKGFILDEVSMISSDTLDTAEMIARQAREEDAPWGGLKVVVVGDFAQLPPVIRRHKNAGAPASTWAFLSQAWRYSRFLPLLLTQNMRSQHSEFTSILNQVRIGQIDSTVTDFLDAHTTDLASEEDITRLFAHRAPTADLNLQKLEQLPGTVVSIPTVFWGDQKSVDQLKKSSPIPETLQLKPNALVMIKQNDPKQRYVNGSQGHIEKIDKEHLHIRLLNSKQVQIEKATFSWLDANGAVVAAATNFPVDLAYATTIHKSQGATLDRLYIDLRRLWEPGQAYVALSRASHPDGLHILAWERNSFKASEQVAFFHEECAKYSPLSKINPSPASQENSTTHPQQDMSY